MLKALFNATTQEPTQVPSTGESYNPFDTVNS